MCCEPNCRKLPLWYFKGGKTGKTLRHSCHSQELSRLLTHVISCCGSIPDKYPDDLLGGTTRQFQCCGRNWRRHVGAQNAIDERKEKGDADKRTTTMLVASRLGTPKLYANQPFIVAQNIMKHVKTEPPH